MQFAEESFAREILDRTRRTPQMWAATKDGFVTRVGTILEMAGSDPRPFYDHLYKAQFFRVGESKDDFTDTWAHAVIDLGKAYL